MPEDAPPSTPEDPITAAHDALPACKLADGDAKIDLARGCAGGICVGMTVAEGEALVGTAQCDEASPGWLWCSWSSGAAAWIRDGDGDGVADEGATIAEVIVRDPFRGATDTGLALGVSMACFDQVLGAPEEIAFWDFDGTWGMARFEYFDLGLTVWDWLDEESYDIGTDGYADYLYLSGS